MTLWACGSLFTNENDSAVNPHQPPIVSMIMSSHILLTIDVEDWFQVENFKQWIPFSSWQSYELRVEKNTHYLLDILDSIKLDKKTNPTPSPKGTFFVLGWIGERLPHLIREIHSRGHEVASHGYCHTLCKECSSEDLREDLIDSKK
ncbi:MAG: polysaccharide deacetylase family protein, partial [Thermodesulfobacteriota bacterium]|nr:polysaccharide deacetylase family protein [Thermodesulfobacteriota bacterium]